MALKTTNKNRKKLEQTIKEVDKKGLSEYNLKRIIVGIGFVLLIICLI